MTNFLNTRKCIELVCNEASIFPFSCTFSNITIDFSTKQIAFNPADRNNTVMVSFTKSTVTQIPVEIFDYFPYLRQLNVQNCAVHILIPNTFSNASNLVHLQLGHNNITQLKDGVMYGLGNLTQLELAHNQIFSISDNVFIDLTLLKTLDLSYNYIAHLSDMVFSKMYSLETLLMDHNHIVRINKMWFKDTKNMMLASFTHNIINFIHDDTFIGLDELFQLRLSGNQLMKFDMRNIDAENLDIDNNSIRSLYVSKQVKKVLRLDAQNNKISKLRCDHNPKLVGLILTNNNLNDLSCIAKMRRLELLYLGQNKIRTIERQTFNNLINLVILSLENNEIEFLDSGLFDQQLSLRTLIISNNRLRKFNSNIFPIINVVDTIHINGNHLTAITYENIKQTLPHLNIVDLSDNDWHCTYLAAILQVMEKEQIKCLKTTDLNINIVNVKGIKCIADIRQDISIDMINEKIMKLELEMINNQLNHANVMRRINEIAKKIFVLEAMQNNKKSEF